MGDIDTFPRHFHHGSEDEVVPSHIPEDDPETALREFLNFAIEIIVIKKLAGSSKFVRFCFA